MRLSPSHHAADAARAHPPPAYSNTPAHTTESSALDRLDKARGHSADSQVSGPPRRRDRIRFNIWSLGLETISRYGNRRRDAESTRAECKWLGGREGEGAVEGALGPALVYRRGDTEPTVLGWTLDMASAGDMLNMMSPWAITKKVKKPVDPVEAIMKNRSKLKKDARRDDDGVAKEEMSTSKERKALKQTARRFCPPAHDVGVNDVSGKKQKSKASPESTEGDARVTKKAKTGTGSESEMSKPKKKVATQGSGDHAPANVNDDGGARRPEQLTSPGTRYSLHERAYTVCTAQENSARSAFCVVMARLALPASGNSLPRRRRLLSRLSSIDR